MRGYCCLVLTMLALTACGANQQSAPLPPIDCEIPRPQVCTMEYAPVCANLVAGGTAEYSSGCNACADDKVASYLPDPCPTDGN